jgi:hypothetical protein
MRRELPTGMAADAIAAGSDVLAVVNGDYDEGGLGVSVGAAITDGRLWTTRDDAEPALAILRSGMPVIDIPKTSIELRQGHHQWRVGTLNKSLRDDAAPALYTREFPRSIKGEDKMRALWIAGLSRGLPLQTNTKVRGRVVAKLDGMREIPIPYGALVLVEKSAVPPRDSVFHAVSVGDKVEVRLTARIAGQKRIRDLVGGSPIIVRDGHRDIVGPASANLRLRHPRTAVCYNDRTLIFVAVDGRQPRLSVGMNLEELADLMISLGCRVAMNTDGGGSTVMAVALPEASLAGAPLRIVNSPSDGKERGRGNAWLVIRARPR